METIEKKIKCKVASRNPITGTCVIKMLGRKILVPGTYIKSVESDGVVVNTAKQWFAILKLLN